jgi:hypothetical protein
MSDIILRPQRRAAASTGALPVRPALARGRGLPKRLTLGGPSARTGARGALGGGPVALVVLQRAGQQPPAGRRSVSALVREACVAAGKPDDLAKRSTSLA